MILPPENVNKAKKAGLAIDSVEVAEIAKGPGTKLRGQYLVSKTGFQSPR